MSDGGWDRWVVVDSYHGVGGGAGRGYYLSLIYFYMYFCLFGLSCPVSFLSEKSMIAVVSVSLFIICFLCLWSL